MAIWFRDNDGDDLIPLRRAADALQVRLQAVGKLGLPRYMVAKKAAYKKKDIEAFLMADLHMPNPLLRELQEEDRQAKLKQKAHPSRVYRPRSDLSSDEAKAAKQASKENRKKPPTKDELARDPWMMLRLKRFR